MMDRRSFLGTGAAAITGGMVGGLGLPAAALADGGATRVFRIMRAGKDIGRHSLSARRQGSRFEVDIDIDIRVKFLGITAYRYAMTNREVWEGGRIVSVDSTTDDDGTDERLSIRREGAVLAVDGTGYSGEAPGEAVTTTYFVPGFLERRPWLSTQSGARIDFSASAVAGAARTYQLQGDIESRLSYDADGEWVDNRFEGRGEVVSYEVIEPGAVAALWRAAA